MMFARLFGLKFPVLQLVRAGGRLGLLETKTNSAQLGLQAGAWAELGNYCAMIVRMIVKMIVRMIVQ